MSAEHNTDNILPADEALRAWMASNGQSQADVARAAGIDQSHMSKILKRKTRPGLAASMAIQDLTGIPARSWLKVAIDPAPAESTPAPAD